ncbi:MAG: DUF3368 domain-containing protein [Desulfobacterales bacterium]|uniref:DUF3368 domain-containing protein n=1 Tax=Candidatus Desulfaltia bathyphila TaxID=2841697 RepID=A0A8J6N2D8_9BACT|nr:DUF3368 domain-containing protein [Candidatus Desulfaltia bathyphila]MBL7207816.1 DUF3368 domain-containing protein [Desulfobacterales bacterium]
MAKDKKIISKIQPIVEQMVKRGRWYSKNVIDKFLGDVGEFCGQNQLPIISVN